MSAIQSETKFVPIDSVFENEFNYRAMDAATFQRAIDGIHANGFIPPIIVRQVDDGYEVIDGAHRLQVCQRLQWLMVPVINLGTITDERAKALMIQLNETHGTPDEAMLASLLHELKTSEDEVIRALAVGTLPVDDYADAIAALAVGQDAEPVPVVPKAKPSPIMLTPTPAPAPVKVSEEKSHESEDLNFEDAVVPENASRKQKEVGDPLSLPLKLTVNIHMADADWAAYGNATKKSIEGLINSRNGIAYFQ
jgi:hypothetical protein